MKKLFSDFFASSLPKSIAFILTCAASIVLYRAIQSAGLWTSPDLLKSVLILTTIGLALYGGLWILFRDALFSGFTAGLSLLFYFLGATFSEILFQKISALSGYNLNVLPENMSVILLIVSGFLFLGLIVFLRIQSIRKPQRFQFFVSLLSWIITAETLFFGYQMINSGVNSPEKQTSFDAFLPDTFPNKETLPDIYFLLFDEMMSPAALIHNYDLKEANSWKDSLKKRHFWVSDSTTSRFTETLESVQAMMNTDTAAHTFALYKTRNRIQQSEVYKTLEKAGYQLHNYSIFPMLNQEVKAGQIDYFDRINTFQSFVLSGTWVAKMKKNKAENSRDSAHQQLMNQVENLSKTPSDSPRFVYAHFMLPHPPFGLKRDGSFFSKEEVQQRTLTDLYLEQCLYAFRVGLSLSDTILANNHRPAVIILTGDHGFRVHYYGLKTTNPEQANQVFHAVYSPDSLSAYPVKDLSVMFAPLLNHYLKTTIPIKSEK